MEVLPTLTEPNAPVAAAVARRRSAACSGASRTIVVSPGTYDQKHIDRIGRLRRLHRLRPGHPRSRAPARRVRRHRRHGRLRQGDGAQRSMICCGRQIARPGQLPRAAAPARHDGDLLAREIGLQSGPSLEGECSMGAWKSLLGSGSAGARLDRPCGAAAPTSSSACSSSRPISIRPPAPRRRSTRSLYANVFEGLTRIDAGGEVAARPSRRAGTISADGLTYTFHLHDRRQVPRRHAVHRRRRQVLARPRPRRRFEQRAEAALRQRSTQVDVVDPATVKVTLDAAAGRSSSTTWAGATR